MALRIQIAKFKIHQYLLRANSPNLMLAKFSRYTASYFTKKTIVHKAFQWWRDFPLEKQTLSLKTLTIINFDVHYYH